jgi:hypothetical protein
MEPVKFLIKIKIAEILFNSQVVKHYTKFLKASSYLPVVSFAGSIVSFFTFGFLIG